MALVQLHGRANDPQTRQLLAAQLIGQGLSGFGQAMRGQKERDALGALLAGKAGPGLSQITQQGAPGMDPSLAGPALGMTQPGGMAQPGMMHTGGQMTPQMAQAFMLQGGDPSTLASLMPKQMTPYETAQVDIERQKLAQPAGPQSGIGKIVADMGGDPTNPADLARAAEIMKSTQAGTNVSLKMPAPYPAAPAGMHYEGDFGAGQAQLVPTPGYAPELSGPAAAAQALVPGALSEAPQIGAALFPGGQFDRGAAATMNTPGIGAIPNTAGEGLRAAMQAGTMAILRHESGGAITDEEIANKLSTYMPSPLDTPDVARQKFERYTRDLQSTSAVASRGRGEFPQQPPAPAQAPAQPGVMDQLLQQGTGAVQQMLGGGPPAPGAPAQSGPAQPPQSPQIGEGSIATNPSTGQSLILRNGQWVPL